MTEALALLGAAAALGIGAGYAFGGRLSGLAAVPLRSWWLVWAALALQFVPGWGALLVSYALIGAWLALNARAARTRALRAAILVLAAGSLLNTATIVANHGMPGPPGAGGLHGQVPASAGGVLGDSLELGSLLVSPGDIVLWLGLIAALAAAMRLRAA